MKSYKPGYSILIATGLLLFSLLALTSAQAQERERNGQPFFSLSTQVVSADATNVTSALGLSPTNILNQIDSSLDTEIGWGITGSVGWLYDSNWHFEAELGHKAMELGEAFGGGVADTIGGEWNIETFFMNGGYDFRGDSFITPYVGLGIGVGLHELTVNQVATIPVIMAEQFQVTPAAQARVGVNFEVAEDMDITMGYRFMALVNPDFNSIAFENLYIHNFEVGLKFYIEDMIYD